MVRQTAKTIAFEIFGGLIVLLLLGVGLLAYRLSTGPMELGIFKDDIARALTNARDGRSVKLDKVQLEWSPSDRRVFITATDLVFLDEGGEPAARAARADIVLDATSLLFGKVEPLRLALHDGWLAIERTDAGWLIAGEPMTAPPLALGETPEEWLDSINQILIDLMADLKADREELKLESISFENFDLSLVLGGRAPLELSSARGRLDRREGMKLSVSGQGRSSGLPGGLAFEIRLPEAFDDIAVEIAFSDWPLEDLATRLGLAEGQVSGLPADVSVTLDAVETEGLETIELSLVAGEGALHIGARDVGIRELSVVSHYNAAEDALTIDAARLDAGPVNGALVLLIADAVTGGDRRAWRLDSEDLQLDFRSVFDRVWSLPSLSGSGTYLLEARQLDIDRAGFGIGAGRMNVSGSIRQATERSPGELPFFLRLNGELLGPVDREDVLTFWPEKLGSGARNYLLNRIETATVTDATFRIDIQPDSMTAGHLPHEAVSVDLSIRDALVRFLKDLPPVENASGTGHLSGNSFSVQLSSGSLGSWELYEGGVEFPQFAPKGADFRVFAKGRGEVRDLIQVISDSRLQLQARTGFDPEDMSGSGDLTFEMFRPALDNVTYDQVRYTVAGTIRSGGLQQAALGFDLTDASARIDMDQESLTISGFGQLGPAPVQFTWRDGLNDGGAPASLSASAVVDNDVLNRFGILGRAYMTGDVPVEVQALLKGRSFSSADIALDLETARIDFPEIGWTKRAGVAAKATISLSESEGNSLASARLETQDALFDGDMLLDADRRIISADLRRAYLRGRTDVQGTVRRLADDSLAISLSGPMLDLSDALGDVGAIAAGGGGLGGAVTLDAEVETLQLRDGLDMKSARIALISASDRLKSLIASGTTISGAAFETSYEASDRGGANVSVTSDDAGFLAQAFLGADFLLGGRLDLKGTLASGDLPTRLEINVYDGRMKNAPFLTQILSLASLRGLADTLGGNGVLFSRIEVPLTIAGGRYVINGGRASGPALGLTANGWIGSREGGINIDGVLVPSFGMNSALGGIPIIGDLVVGRQGEGIFSLTYSIRGSLDRAQVSVNPLSGILPGVLRRIFENPADTEVPASEPGPIVLPELQLEPLPEPEVIGGG